MSGKLACLGNINENKIQTPPDGYLFLAKESQTGMGEQSEANPKPKRKKTK